MNLQNEFNCIREWAEIRGLYEQGDKKTQFLKLVEEVGELGSALLKEDKNLIIDAVGDIVIVLTNLIKLCNLYREHPLDIRDVYQINIEHCINTAFNEIKNRKGKMSNGTFQKEI